MPKLGMGPIRRKQLVEAAIAVIHEQGFASATVARIARRAGISAGHGASLFPATRTTCCLPPCGICWRNSGPMPSRGCRAARAPMQRLHAIIDACFGEEQFDEQVFSAWLALYGNARQSARLRNILSLYHRRLQEQPAARAAPPAAGARGAAHRRRHRRHDRRAVAALCADRKARSPRDAPRPHARLSGGRARTVFQRTPPRD